MIDIPSQDEMMSMLKESFESSAIDFPTLFKALWFTNALNGCEDDFGQAVPFGWTRSTVFSRRAFKKTNTIQFKSNDCNNHSSQR